MIVVVFSATLVVSASLVFLVQPMFARFVLPLLGSSPAVWITALLFFQTALLVGYLYAHVSTRRLGVRRQAFVHLLLVAVALAFLPIGIPDGWDPPVEGSPVPWLLALLTVAIGVPFLVVSATAPLLQRWLSETDTPAARDPYFLYRASNLGSIAGLLAYPLAVEPGLRLAEQGKAWAYVYGALALLLLASAVLLWRAPRRNGAAPIEPPASGREAAPTTTRRFRWVALAAVPSSLMLGVTTFLTTDIAPVPMLWVAPLVLYLLSFVIVFAPGAEWVHTAMIRATPLWVALFVVLVVFEVRRPLGVLVALHLLVFFVIALACHGRLAGNRPTPEHLTSFYLLIALGGALGGAFNALVAPLLFDTAAEYPLAVVAACFLLPDRSVMEPGRWTRRFDFAIPVALALFVAGLLVALDQADERTADFGRTYLLAMAAGLLIPLSRRPVRFGLTTAAVLAVATSSLGQDRRPILTERSFFGVHRVEVEEGSGVHRLLHGTTAHGAQDPRRPREPLTYYHRSGPVGELMATLPRTPARREAGVIGLGTGTIACYGRPAERWTFYEIDPVVERIARDPRYFSYLRDCPPRSEVVLGDARLSLRRLPDRRLGLLVADAFNSDAIPIHLLTREAIALYMRKLTPDGVLVFNISNRYLKLEPMLGRIARDLRLACVGRDEGPSEVARIPLKYESHWAVIAARRDSLGTLPSHPGWRGCPSEPGERAWTDDYSNLLDAL